MRQKNKEENLNLAEILKDCPTGTKLYSPVYGDVELVKAFSQEEAANFHIVVKLSDGETAAFTKGGKLFVEYNGECMLFPGKDQRDWNKFKVKQPVNDKGIIMWVYIDNLLLKQFRKSKQGKGDEK